MALPTREGLLASPKFQALPKEKQDQGLAEYERRPAGGQGGGGGGAAQPGDQGALPYPRELSPEKQQQLRASLEAAPPAARPHALRRRTREGLLSGELQADVGGNINEASRVPPGQEEGVIPGAIRALENRAGQGWDWWKGVAHGAGDVTKQVLQDAGVPERYARIPADYGVEPIVKYAPAMALAET